MTESEREKENPIFVPRNVVELDRYGPKLDTLSKTSDHTWNSCRCTIGSFRTSVWRRLLERRVSALILKREMQFELWATLYLVEFRMDLLSEGQILVSCDMVKPTQPCGYQRVQIFPRHSDVENSDFFMAMTRAKFNNLWNNKLHLGLARVRISKYIMLLTYYLPRSF
jgi:hypothetical protein